jgi:putative Mn2+ efflux pump MntP
VTTAFDWLSVALFSALALLFLIRSAQPEPRDRMIAYLPPALGCMVGNQLGNHDQPLWGAIVLIGVAVYIVRVLKPTLPGRPNSD